MRAQPTQAATPHMGDSLWLCRWRTMLPRMPHRLCLVVLAEGRAGLRRFAVHIRRHRSAPHRAGLSPPGGCALRYAQ
jgi:hypothetical protein